MKSTFNYLSKFLRQQDEAVLIKFSVQIADRFIESLDINYNDPIKVRNVYLCGTVYSILVKDIRLVSKVFGNLGLLQAFIKDLKAQVCINNIPLKEQSKQFFQEQMQDLNDEIFKIAYAMFDKNKFIDAVIQTQNKEFPNILG